jgi:hypothetical protein
MASGYFSQSTVEPSISVNRKVTVPEGTFEFIAVIDAGS